MMVRMNRIAAVVLLASVLGCATSAAEGPDPDIQWIDERQSRGIKDVYSKGEDPNHVRVCEWEEITGSRLRQKVCRNLSTNEQERAAAQKTIFDLQQSATQKAQ